MTEKEDEQNWTRIEGGAGLELIITEKKREYPGASTHFFGIPFRA